MVDQPKMRTERCSVSFFRRCTDWSRASRAHAPNGTLHRHLSDDVLNLWSSRKADAEGDSEPNWNNKKTAIICIAEKGGKLYGGAAGGGESEMAETSARWPSVLGQKSLGAPA